MENKFKIDNDCLNDAMVCAKNAAVYCENFGTKLDELSIKAGNTGISNLNYGNVNNAKSMFSEISNLDSTIGEVKNEAMKAIISMDGFQYKLIEMAEKGDIAAVDVVEIANIYMQNLIKEDPDYFDKLKEIDNTRTMLKENGFSKEFIDSLNAGFCENLIRKDKMYSREGMVDMSYSFTGLLAMFGCRLTYGPSVGGHFDNLHHGLYLGTEEEAQLCYLDCCNYYDWLARCAGIDMYAYGASDHYKYGIDIDGYENCTPENQYMAIIGDDYFKQGQAADILETKKPGHLRMIVERTDDGYLVTESAAGGIKYKFYTYQDIENDTNYEGYHVSNMDAVFRNTTSGKIGMFRDTYPDEVVSGYPKIRQKLAEAKEDRIDGGIFFSPRELAKQLNLSPELENELIKQYNKRNENPNIREIPEIL